MTDVALQALPRPEPGEPRPYEFPRWDSATLDNGLKVIVAPVTKLPVVSVLLVVDGSVTAEKPGQEGSASITARALSEGSRHRTGDQIAETAELLGMSIGAGADWDAASVRMTVLRDRLESAMSLLAEVVLEPSFPAREVERLKAERIADIMQQRTEPRGLADELFARFLYAERSRYGAPDDGTVESVGALNRDVLQEFWGKRYVPDGATLVVVGDIAVESALDLARRHFGSWHGEASQRPRLEDAPARLDRAVHLVAKADAPQSELRIGHVGLARSHPDYFPVVVMNMILGGVFSSRINLNLREVNAFTYGAHSNFDWRHGAGPFSVDSAVRSDVTMAAVREVLIEIERMRDEPVKEAELSLATAYLQGVFPIRYETTDAIARALSAMVVYGLPADYFDTYRDRIAALTIEDIHRAAQRHLHPEQLQIVVVGDPGVVEQELRDAGLGPVSTYDVEGALVR